MDNIEKTRRDIINTYVEFRKQRGITQQQLADGSGLKRPNISRFESGESNPTLDMLIRLADELDLQIEIVAKGGRE